MVKEKRLQRLFDRAGNAVKAVPQAPRKMKAYARRKPIRAFLLASLAIGTATQFAPATVSRSLDDHMAAKGAPSIEPYFTTDTIRVFHRYNPLQAPHMMVLSIRTNGPYILDAPLRVPYSIVSTSFQSAVTTIIPTTLDAYSFGNAAEGEDRRCFIRPPSHTSLRNYLNAFSGFDADSYTFNNQDKLGEMFFTYIMAHEARHCDQRGWGVPDSHIRESDADIYALRVLGRVYGEPAAQELGTMLGHIRVISAIRNKDDSHASSRAMGRADQSVVHSTQDQALYDQLRTLLKTGTKHNENLFDNGKHTRMGKYYHVARALLQDSNFKDVELRRVTASFVNAIAYFDNHTPEQIVRPLPANSIVQTLNLTTYTPPPAPLSPLSPPAAAPAPLSPRPTS